MLAAARRGDLDERTTCADEDCVDAEVGGSQAVDRYAIGVSDRDNEFERGTVADRGDPLDDWSLCSRTSRLNDKSAHRWTSFSPDSLKLGAAFTARGRSSMTPVG